MLHPWDVPIAEAARIQKDLAAQIRIEKYTGPIRLIAGADLSFERFSDIFHAGFVVLEFPSMKLVARSSAVVQVKFPYVPGFLTFREGPALMRAWEALEVKPDVVVFDGQGIAHPRGMGVASHMGLLIDRPSIGCGKSPLIKPDAEPSNESGAAAALTHNGRPIGYALRTKKNCNPVYVSPGHRIDAEGALEIVRKCVGRYRIPEPTRLAHHWANELRRSSAMIGK